VWLNDQSDVDGQLRILVLNARSSSDRVGSVVEFRLLAFEFSQPFGDGFPPQTEPGFRLAWTFVTQISAETPQKQPMLKRLSVREPPPSVIHLICDFPQHHPWSSLSK
jgi:hypothetical protein